MPAGQITAGWGSGFVGPELAKPKRRHQQNKLVFSSTIPLRLSAQEYTIHRQTAHPRGPRPLPPPRGPPLPDMSSS